MSVVVADAEPELVADDVAEPEPVADSVGFLEKVFVTEDDDEVVIDGLDVIVTEGLVELETEAE